MTPLDIDAIFQSNSSSGGDGLIPEPSFHRSEVLRLVLAVAQDLWQSGSPELDLVAQKIGDGSRDGELHHLIHTCASRISRL